MSLAALDALLSCYSPQIVSGGHHFGIRRITLVLAVYSNIHCLPKTKIVLVVPR